MRINCFGRNGLKRFSFNFSLAPFRPQPLMIFNPGHCADGCFVFAFFPGVETPGYYNQTLSGFSLSTSLLFLIPYSLPVRSGGYIPYFFYILQTEVSFSFRPQPLLVFNPGHSADGGFVVPFLSRGCVRSSLTPVTIIKSLQDFQPSIFVIPYSIFLILSSNPPPLG